MALASITLETQHDRRTRALGRTAQELLALSAQPRVEEVSINPNGSLWVKRTGEGFSFLRNANPEWVRSILLQIAYQQGFQFGPEHPILETDIPETGDRLTGLCRPMVRGVALTIRPHPKVSYTMEDYRTAGIVSHLDDARNAKTRKAQFRELVHGKDHAEILSLAIQYRQNILVGGSTGSGKTTFLNMLFSLIGKLCPQDRVVGIEDTFELQWQAIPNHVPLLATHGISAARCLETALRLNPHRIVVGEIRKCRAARALLDAWNTGHRGGMATVHADDARSALQRFEEILQDRHARPAIARAVNVVAFIDESDQLQAGRKLKEVLLIEEYDKDKGDYELTPV